MTTYTISAPVVAPLLRDADEGQLIQISFDVLKDGAAIGSVDQRYGISVTNAEIRDDLTRQIRDLVAIHYDGVKRTALAARCAAIAANLADFSKVLP